MPKFTANDYQKLQELAQKDDYRELVDFSIQLTDQSLPEKERCEDEVADFYQELFADKEHGYEKFTKVSKAMIDIKSEYYLAFFDKMEDYEQKIRNGEIEGTELIKDDPKQVSKLAGIMAIGENANSPENKNLKNFTYISNLISENAPPFDGVEYQDMEKMAVDQSNEKWNNIVGYTPEQVKKIQTYLMIPVTNGKYGDFNCEPSIGDEKFKFEPAGKLKQIVDCKTHEELDDLKADFEKKAADPKTNNAIKEVLNENMAFFDKAHDLIDLKAMPEYKENVTLKAQLREYGKIKKSIHGDDLYTYSHDMIEAQKALAEAADFFSLDRATRKPGDMSESYKAVCSALEDFTKLNINKTNPVTAYQKLAEVLRSSESYYGSHTGIKNLFKGNSDEGKARVDWSDKVRKAVSPFVKSVEPVADKMVNFSKDTTFTEISMMLNNEGLESKIGKKIAQNDQTMNEKLEAKKAERAAAREAKAAEANKPFDLDEQISKAQADIKKIQADVRDNFNINGVKIPSKDDASAGEQYAKIFAAHYLKIHNKNDLEKKGINIHDEASFNNFVQTVRASKDFKEMIKRNTSNTLFEHSMRDKGQDIFQDYTAAHNARVAEEKKPLQGNQMELDKERAPKALGDN